MATSSFVTCMTRREKSSSFEDFNQLQTFECIIIASGHYRTNSSRLLGLLSALASLYAYCFHIICVVVLNSFNLTPQA